MDRLMLRVARKRAKIQSVAVDDGLPIRAAPDLPSTRAKACVRERRVVKLVIVFPHDHVQTELKARLDTYRGHGASCGFL